jgi:hypothetical protein
MVIGLLQIRGFIHWPYSLRSKRTIAAFGGVGVVFAQAATLAVLG